MSDQVSAVLASDSTRAIRKASAPKPVTPMDKNINSTTACSGFDLIRILYGLNRFGPYLLAKAQTTPMRKSAPAISPTAV